MIWQGDISVIHTWAFEQSLAPFAPRKVRITSTLTFDIYHVEWVRVDIKKGKRNSELQIEESNRRK
jgi:hypothetical protein